MDWYDYEQQKAIALPPVGVDVQMRRQGEGWFDGQLLFAGEQIFVVLHQATELSLRPYHIEFRPLDHATHKAEADKKQFVDYVTSLLYSHCCATKGELRGGAIEMYKLGFRLPESK